ncbi:MAG: family 43 glycosylhydrolase [Eubacteriales bacterium]|nr:family 43 glycosylhydrolase [Eubacteriales bacterium]
MKYYCNPINVNYRYQVIREPEQKKISIAREAADPSLLYYKGKYYIFASMTLGVWMSEDMVTWENHPLPAELPLYDYAPDVRVIGEYVYFSASNWSRPCDFYRTKDVLNGPYEKIEGSFPFWDPNLFADDDGRIYFYWGCESTTPIYGVELDPESMHPIGETKELFFGDPYRHGYERFGEEHSLLPPIHMPYIEGAWMNKRQGKYYLQYACPGTEFNIYADGVYVSEHPLGPFVPARNNPYSYKPGGFLTGAGHGSTLEDEKGRLWHAATMRISMNHKFERRVGLWPAGIDRDGELFCNQRYGDWPRAVRENETDPWRDPEWYLLSYGKRASASSFEEGHEAALAADENVQTWWRAAGSQPGEWICLDLGETQRVHAVQINFADDRIEFPEAEKLLDEQRNRYIVEKDFVSRWLLEGSEDGLHFQTIADKTEAVSDLPHDLIVIEEGIICRYLKLTVLEMPFGQNACVSGLRAFGKGNGEKPEIPVFHAVRIGDLDMQVTIGQQKNTVGYNILWGSDPEKLYHSYQVFGTEQTVGALVKEEDYFVRVDAFNENGITEGSIQKLLKAYGDNEGNIKREIQIKG